MFFHRELGHRVQPVVAGQTIAAVGFLMQGHEGGVFVCVAGGTGGQGNGVVGLADVTGGAVQAAAVVIAAVPIQTESGEAVVEVGYGRCQQIILTPPMIEMTGGTLVGFG